jgi:hypothetical protein
MTAAGVRQAGAVDRRCRRAKHWGVRSAIACLLAAGCYDVSALQRGSDAAVDLAGGDLGSGPTPSLCGGGAFVLCEGFESGAIGAPWTESTPSGQLTVDGAHVYRGAHALHVHTNAFAAGGAAHASLSETKSFAQTGAKIYVRAFVYVPSPAPNADGVLMAAQQEVSPFHGEEVYLTSSKLRLLDNVPQTYTTHDGADPFPLDRWFCVEWAIDTSGPTTTVSLDGNQEISSTDPNQPQPGLGGLAFGLQYYNQVAQGAVDIWLDELVVDGAPIGCDR